MEQNAIPLHPHGKHAVDVFAVLPTRSAWFSGSRCHVLRVTPRGALSAARPLLTVCWTCLLKCIFSPPNNTGFLVVPQKHRASLKYPHFTTARIQNVQPIAGDCRGNQASGRATTAFWDLPRPQKLAIRGRVHLDITFTKGHKVLCAGEGQPL